MKKVLSLILSLTMLLALTACGSGAESVLEEMVSARENGDHETYVELAYDPYCLKYEAEHYGNGDSVEDYTNDIITSLEANYKSMQDYFGDDISIVEFNVEKVRVYEEDTVKKIAAYLTETYDYPESSLEDICIITFYEHIEGEKDVRSSTGESIMLKIDGEWYGGNSVIDQETINHLIYD